MLLGESINGKPVYNGYNHNEHGDPHPQYDRFRTWNTKSKTGSTEQWINIFKGEFQKDPDSLPKNDRAFHRLLYSFYLYNMNDDAAQDITLCTYLFMVNNAGVLTVDGRNISMCGLPITTKIYYKCTDNTKKIYDVRLYISSDKPYTKFKILPIIYDPINNYDAPMHLESVYQGLNVKDKIDVLYKDLITREWKNVSELTSELTGYTEVIIRGDLGYTKSQGHSLIGDTTRLRFKDSNENQLAMISSIKNDKVLKFESNGVIEKYGFDRTISPSETNVDLGYDDYRFNVGYFHKMNIKIYEGYAALPTTNKNGDMVLYKNPDNGKYFMLVWIGTAWKKASELTSMTF